MKKIYVTTGLLSTFLLTSLTAFGQSQSRADILKEIETKRNELAALEKSFLEPTKEDRSQYAEFLRASDTGLIRLLPREKYDSYVLEYNQKNRITGTNRATITGGSFSRKQHSDLPQGQQGALENTNTTTHGGDVPTADVEKVLSKKGLSVTGGGAYYSFSRRSHDYGQGTDIGLENGHLQSGFAGANYGFMVNVGDIPLENISLELPDVNALATYQPAVEEPHARVEQRRFSSGTEVNGLQVIDRLPLRSDSTYLVRVLNYHRTDVLVAFRVLRVDPDGSAVILWKLLKKYPAPQLARTN